MSVKKGIQYVQDHFSDKKKKKENITKAPGFESQTDKVSIINNLSNINLKNKRTKPKSRV